MPIIFIMNIIQDKLERINLIGIALLNVSARKQRKTAGKPPVFIKTVAIMANWSFIIPRL
ncbi:hypothetical protein AAUPMB_07937 [Pasteurella multocida subsp. multocida str. Anand1_buffalo]|nr:hypothetical protein AAUPMB_07937 [Pasteurella multocida subsp. multocida str. Anand1_buffalo]